MKTHILIVFLFIPLINWSSYSNYFANLASQSPRSAVEIR